MNNYKMTYPGKLNFNNPEPGLYQEFLCCKPHDRIPTFILVYYISGEKGEGLQPESRMNVPGLRAFNFGGSNPLIDRIDAEKFYKVTDQQLEGLLASEDLPENFIEWLCSFGTKVNIELYIQEIIDEKKRVGFSSKEFKKSVGFLGKAREAMSVDAAADSFFKAYQNLQIINVRPRYHDRLHRVLSNLSIYAATLYDYALFHHGVYTQTGLENANRLNKIRKIAEANIIMNYPRLRSIEKDLVGYYFSTELDHLEMV